MTIQRRLYNALIRLHPASFRRQFGRDMSLDFEDALATYGFPRLLLDAVHSLARQWAACAFSAPEPAPQFAPASAGHPFLAGHYIAADRGRLSFLDWAGATVLSTLLILTIAFAASVPNPHALAYLQVVRVNHDSGIGIDNTPPHSAEIPGQYELPATVPLPAPSGFAGKLPPGGRVHLNPYYARMAPLPGPRARGGPPVQPITLAEAVAQLALISAIVWITSFLLRRSPGAGRRAAIATLGLLGIAASVAFGQPPAAPIHAQVLHATAPLPSFEVATIKPRDPNARIMMTPPGSENLVHYVGSARQLIADAYNVATTVQQQVTGGPDWVGDNNKAYVVEGKIPDSLYARMQSMTADERHAQASLMLQSLLADRFQLKVHFETRELPVYELTIAQSGPKLPPPNDAKPAATPGPNGTPQPPQMGGGETITQTGVRIRNMSLDGMLTAPWFGLSDRPIVNKTGLTGTYNVTLNWIPDIAGRSGQNGVPAAPEDQVSIFTALEEQLGLKLVSTKAPVEVIIIDHIDRPTEN